MSKDSSEDSVKLYMEISSINLFKNEIILNGDVISVNMYKSRETHANTF